MTAEIRRLTGAGPIVEPDSDIIQLLRELLDMAEHGDIKGLGFFGVKGNDAITCGWRSGCADQHDMICGSAQLHHRIMATWHKQEFGD